MSGLEFKLQYCQKQNKTNVYQLMSIHQQMNTLPEDLHYYVIERDEFLIHGTAWMRLENMLSERS
jgi:hypothetical protein